MLAVIIPHGSSTGANKILPNKSDVTKIIATHHCSNWN